MNVTNRAYLIAGSALVLAGWTLAPVPQGAFDWSMGVVATGVLLSAVAAASGLAVWFQADPYPQDVHCLRCGATFVTPVKLEDLRLAGPDAAIHYRDICLPCRRHVLDAMQGRPAR